MQIPVRLKTETNSEYNQRVCKLLYHDGCSINEIAAALNITNTEVFNYTHEEMHYLTKKDCHLIFYLKDAGYDTKYIAKMIGVTENTIQRRLKLKDEIPFDSFVNGEAITYESLELIKRLYNKEMSTGEIARIMHLTEHKVRYRLQKCNLYTSRVNSNATKEEVAEWKKLHAQGKSYTEIGKAFNRSRNTIARHVNKK